MVRALYLALSLLVFPLAAAHADAPSKLGANAALKYWQAFSQLPRLSDAEQKKLREEFLTMPLDAQTRNILTSTKTTYAFRMMYQGAALAHCDWGINYEAEGIGALLPHLSPARLLSTLACLRARMRFEEGRPAEALDDIVAALTLGRHASRDGSLIGVLVGYEIEDRVNETLARYLPKLDAETIKALKKRLDALPAGESPAAAMRECEEKSMEWFVRKVKEAKDEESLLDFLSPHVADSRESLEKRREKGRAFLKELGGSADAVVTFWQEMRPCYASMAQKLNLPPDEFAKEWEREQTKRAGNVLFKTFFPAIAKVCWRRARADESRALLSAALAVQLDGRGALKDHPDPIVGGPFEYVAFEGGFELRSKWKVDEKLRAKWKLDDRYGKPLTLTVGQRGK